MNIFIRFRYFIQKIVLKFNFLDIKELFLVAISFTYFLLIKYFFLNYMSSQEKILFFFPIDINFKEKIYIYEKKLVTDI